MEVLYTLEDLKEIARESGNDNPSIFILSDMKTIKNSEEAFPPTNINVDENGDIVIMVDEYLLKNG